MQTVCRNFLLTHIARFLESGRHVAIDGGENSAGDDQDQWIDHTDQYLSIVDATA